LYGQNCKYKIGHVFVLLGRCRQEPIIQQTSYVAVEMIQLHRSKIQCRLVENAVMDNLFLCTCRIYWRAN